jgi:hypothetical protein
MHGKSQGAAKPSDPQQMQSASPTIFALNNEFFFILAFTSPRDIATLQLVSKFFRLRIEKDPKTWRNLITNILLARPLTRDIEARFLVRFPYLRFTLMLYRINTWDRLFFNFQLSEQEFGEFVAKLPGCRNMREIRFWKGGLQPAQISMLKRALLAHGGIATLSLCLNPAHNLAELLECASLTTLIVNHCEITDKVAETFAVALMRNTALLHLDLSANRFSDKAAQSLARALSGQEGNSKLVWLELQANDISNAGAEALLEMLKTNTTLAWINLDDDDVNDELVQQLNDAVLVPRVSQPELLQLRKDRLASLETSSDTKGEAPPN